jgi:hypothetical protein
VEASGEMNHTCCAECESGVQYQKRACDARSDTECANCSVCEEGFFEAVACNETHDTVCSACKVCPPGITFAVGECGPETDADRLSCRNCTQCATSVISPCNGMQDAVCGPIEPAYELLLSFAVTSEWPVAAYTAERLVLFCNAVAFELEVSADAVKPGAVRERSMRREGRQNETENNNNNSSSATPLFAIVIDMLLQLEQSTPRVEQRLSMLNLSALSQASGLPIVIHSFSSTRQTNEEEKPNVWTTHAAASSSSEMHAHVKTLWPSSPSSTSALLAPISTTPAPVQRARLKNAETTLLVPLGILLSFCAIRLCAVLTRQIRRRLWRNMLSARSFGCMCAGNAWQRLRLVLLRCCRGHRGRVGVAREESYYV